MKGKKCPKCGKHTVRFYPPYAGDNCYIIPPRERCTKCDYKINLLLKKYEKKNKTKK